MPPTAAVSIELSPKPWRAKRIGLLSIDGNHIAVFAANSRERARPSLDQGAWLDSTVDHADSLETRRSMLLRRARRLARSTLGSAMGCHV